MRHTFGLSPLPPLVARRVATMYGHHRTPWFEGILQDIAKRLRPALGDHFTPLFLTTTALGAREAVISNLIRHSDRVLATPGDFSNLARAWGAFATDVTASAAPPKLQFPPDAVFIEHVLPSGTLLDVCGIVDCGRIAPKAPVVLDASISFGADVADVAGIDVDAVLIAPERALMSIPGVTIVAVTERFLETLSALRPTLTEKPFLFDLLKHHRAWSKQTTPFSPNISACVALQAALDEIDGMGGLLRLPEHHRVRAETVRASLARLGTVAAAGAAQTTAWTTVELASDRDPGALASRLRENSIDARAATSGTYTLQIAHAGYMPQTAVDTLHSIVASIAEPELLSAVAPSQEETPSIEALFTIAPLEFVEQSNKLASRASADPRVRAAIARNARQVFRENHVVHADALRHRRIGFVGAGRIVRVAADLCRARGAQNVTVYSPSLADAISNDPQRLDDGDPLAPWRERRIDVGPTIEELFERATPWCCSQWCTTTRRFGSFESRSDTRTRGSCQRHYSNARSALAARSDRQRRCARRARGPSGADARGRARVASILLG